MWREWRFQSIWALEAKSSQQCSWAARQAGWALDQVDPQLDQLPGKLEGSWRVTTECCQSLPMIARRCGKFSQMDGFPATTLTCCCQEIPPCALGRKINGLGTLVQTFCLWKADGKSFPSAQPLNGDLFVFTWVLCLTGNFKGIHLFREFVTTQPKICCLRSNHSPTTGWRLPDQALNQRASPWQTQSNAFPPLSHSSSAPLLNKSSLRNCIWGNQREGHLAHSAPSLDSRYTPTDPPWFWPSTLEDNFSN